MYALVVVDIPNENVDQLYTYIVPKELEECIHVGSRVYVEFGFQKILGYVLELTDTTNYNLNLKEIIEVIDFENGLTLEQIFLAKELAKNLLTPLTMTLNLMYPSFLKSRIVKSLKVINFEKLNADVALLFSKQRTIPVNNKVLSKYNLIKKEIEKGNLELITSVYTYGVKKKEKFYFLLNNPYPVKSAKRQAVLDYLSSVKEATIQEIKENTGASENIINQLYKTGYLDYKEKLVLDEKLEKTPTYTVNKSMDLEIAKNKYLKVTSKPYLFYTNNNKFRDDFLIEVSKDTVESGKKVLIVTPTILENTRLSNLFNNALNYQILTFTSKLSTSEYYYNYQNLIAGNVDIVITTKSGIFLPLENIGLIIIVDSESSYYLNEQNPKFNALEVLKTRALYHAAKLIFTSSSPSIALYYEYFQNKYTIISKIDAIDNHLELIDMKNEYLNNLLSCKLKQEIKNTLENKKIVCLLLNSLAYNQTVLCTKCSKLIVCPHCKVGLAYYKNKNIYRCNSCNYQVAKPMCECGSLEHKHFGFGLELLKETLEKEYPHARIIQVDSESFTSEIDYQEFQLALEEKTVDIIIGTFPLASIFHDDIELIGLINIDSLLQKNDYRSSEEAYALISKLCMHNNAKVLIQGYNLDNYVIKDALNNDYEDFFTKELKIRKDYNYPPFNEISRLLVIGEYNDIYYFANYFKKVFLRMNTISILGPVYLPRIKGLQLIMKYNDFEKLSRLIEEVKNKFSDRKLIVNFERYPLGFN